MMGESHDQIIIAVKQILLLAESEGICSFEGHQGEADISIGVCLPDAELEETHDPLVMDNLECQLDCIWNATET